jgi:hypothetical protein
MLGALGSASLGILQRPRSLRLKSLVHHLHQVGWQADTNYAPAKVACVTETFVPKAPLNVTT